VNRQAVRHLLGRVLALHAGGDVVVEPVRQRLIFDGVRSSSASFPAMALTCSSATAQPCECWRWIAADSFGSRGRNPPPPEPLNAFLNFIP
jgi:hypothetical protein